MGFCANCGQPRNGNVRFCGSCGTEFDDSPAAPDEQAPAATGWTAPADATRTDVSAGDHAHRPAGAGTASPAGPVRLLVQPGAARAAPEPPRGRPDTYWQQPTETVRPQQRPAATAHRRRAAGAPRYPAPPPGAPYPPGPAETAAAGRTRQQGPACPARGHRRARGGRRRVRARHAPRQAFRPAAVATAPSTPAASSPSGATRPATGTRPRLGERQRVRVEPRAPHLAAAEPRGRRPRSALRGRARGPAAAEQALRGHQHAQLRGVREHAHHADRPTSRSRTSIPATGRPRTPG